MLREHLSALRTVRDCGRLFEQLGYAPDGSPFEERWTVAARWRQFRVVATETRTPRDRVREMARRLCGSSQPGLAVALHRDVELVLAAPRLGAAGSTRLMVVPLANPSRFALEQLAALRPAPGANALAHALRVVEVLTSEEVGERFFTSLRAVHHRMAAHLRGGAAPDRSLVALLALTRVLFLYFVQAKGWLDGRPDYLRALLDATLSRRRHFHRAVLHPLFFGTLNRPHDVRRGPAFLGRVPYLNGGLFEPHPAERRLGPTVFPNGLWRDAFDDLFERYRFCVREDDEVGAIAPDMLGRVFERVMDGEERHATGTYYTPETVVRDLVRATIATALANSPLPLEAAQRVVRGERVDARTRRAGSAALRRLTVLDPAVGSGAFLLGALECLTEARHALRGTTPARGRWRLRRRVLRENLFGVDLSPVAVRLAELRLWLAVVADDPTEDPDQVEPLPNLDGVVRQGDTLLDPLGALRALGIGMERPPSGVAVAAARDRLFDARHTERRAAVRGLRDAEHRLAADAVALAEERTDAALLDLTALANGRDLFGRRTGLTDPQRRRWEALRRQADALATARRHVADEAVPFFSFEVHRPEVTERGGFSVVVGNPPWVRAERLSEHHRAELKHRFTWWRTGPARGFGHLPDLSIAFLQRAVELTAPDGAVGFLVPSKVASAAYGGSARAALVREASIGYLHRVPDHTAARFRATTYPLAIVLKNRPPDEDHVVALGFSGEASVSQRRLTGAGPWVLVPETAQRALRDTLEAGTPLAALARPSLGVKTGADRLFVGRVLDRSPSVVRIVLGDEEVELEAECVRPAIRGRDVKPFVHTSVVAIVWGHDATLRPRRVLPPAARAYFARHERQLARRADHRGGPGWTVFRARAAERSWRVIWPDIARRTAAALLKPTDESVPLNTCYVSHAPHRDVALAIAATLNSTWARTIVRSLADEARGDYRRHNARVVGQVPVAATQRGRGTLARWVARAIKDDHVDQDELDHAVARSLGLGRGTCSELAALARDTG